MNAIKSLVKLYKSVLPFKVRNFLHKHFLFQIKKIQHVSIKAPSIRYVRFYASNPPGQDRWVIKEVFQNMRKPGYFFEAGASDGIRGSTTYALEKYFKWTGILCEPNTRFFERLQKNRSCIVENVCLADKDGSVEFVEAGFYSAVIEYGEKRFGENLLEHEFYQKDGDTDNAQISIKPSVSLASLLKKHNAPPIIHYLSLDIEGGEYEVLKNFPFDQYTFLCMTIERGGRDDNLLNDLLISKGFILTKQVFSDNFWLHPAMYAIYGEQ